jgi:formate C-acetyltransferase
MKFAADAMSGESAAKVRTLVRTFLKRKGFEIQINCVSRDTLLRARENPEQYRDLLVRIGGYSDYFTSQTPEMQQEIIDRSEQSF